MVLCSRETNVERGLVKAESAGTSFLNRLLLLVALLEGGDRGMVSAEVVKVLDLVDTDDPVLTGKGLLDRVKDGTLGGETDTTNSVGSLSRREQGTEVVVGHLVPVNLLAFGGSFERDRGNLHEGVLHGVGSLIIDTVLAITSEEFALLDLIRPDTLGNSDHPEELVDIVTRVAQKTTKDDQNVVNLMLAHDGVADLLAGAHGLANGGDVGVVPGVVVNESGAVGHAANLVAIVPPRHDLGVFRSVLTQPLVGLTVVIDDVLASIRHATS